MGARPFLKCCAQVGVDWNPELLISLQLGDAKGTALDVGPTHPADIASPLARICWRKQPLETPLQIPAGK